ncbi:uncharacterized protein LOC141706495 [Apium graveolens]|uniref:uncharacterized protein LOC141706495 n=1 Tax=Apium graveolens TaxID=4045 RepID=UPI003D7B3C2D
MSSPLLSKPIPAETLYVYLSVTNHAVSGVLTREETSLQFPIYYVSRSLLDAETRYPTLEKLVLALSMTSVKLRHYFESHKICVRTNYPMKTVLSKPELTGRLAKWSIRLSMYDITYESRTTIKSQSLADFMADFSPTLLNQTDEELRHLVLKIEMKPWSLYTDGASNQNGTGLGLVLKSPQGDIVVYSVCCEFKATNNESEYEALIIGLTTTIDLKITRISINCDSLLIVNHVKGIYEAKDEKMSAYLEIVKHLQGKFDDFTIQKIPRELNSQADALAGLGAFFHHENLSSIPVIHILHSAREKWEMEREAMEIDCDSTIEDWRTKYIDYLTLDVQPEDNNEARSFRMKAFKFTIFDHVLFKNSFTGLLQRCLNKTEAEHVLCDKHEGDCGNHSGGRNLS